MRLERYSAMSGVVGEIHQPTDEELFRAKKAIAKHSTEILNRTSITEPKTATRK